MSELPTLKPKIKPGALVLIVIFLGLATVTGVLYYKHQKKVASSQVAVQNIKPKPLELEACNDKTLALEAEVRRLQAQLTAIGQPLSVTPPAPKRVVEVKAKSPKPAQQPQPVKDPQNASQSSWNSTPVPAPILDWLQRD